MQTDRHIQEFLDLRNAVITQALRASARLIGASAPAISETPPKCRNQPNRGFADHLIFDADHLLDVFGSLVMLALSKENWIHRSRAYGQSLIPIVWRIVIRFLRAAVALAFVAPIFWTGSKISQTASLVSNPLSAGISSQSSSSGESTVWFATCILDL
jgi:hypothetical protein